MTLKYFAYGSNMLHYRLWQRVPSCRVLDCVSVRGYSLNYFIRGIDNSGKCNIIETGQDIDCVHGVVFEMAKSDLHRLDAAEGESYEKSEIVLQGEVEQHRAFVYIGREAYIDTDLKPFDWYKAIVVEGARSHNLPDEYILNLNAVVAKKDSDQERSKNNFKIIESIVPE